jgi:hypothetical protein
VALPPAAVVSVETVRAVAKRCRYGGPLALGPLPERAAVDIAVADPQAREDVAHGLVDAAVDAEGEAIAGRSDLVEQRCPALSKAEARTSATTCSASAEESTIIAFCPPVSAMNGTIGPGIRRQNGLFRSINRRVDNSSLLHLQQICSKTSP